MPTSRLPAELGLLVIDHLGAETANDWKFRRRANTNRHFCPDDEIRARTLYRCALTCRDWLPRSQRNLYRKIHIKRDGRLGALRETLERKATLRDHVRYLKAEVDIDRQLHEILFFVRDLLPALHTFHLINVDEDADLRLSNVTRSLLAVGFPSVRSLVLYRFSGSWMSHLLRGFPELKELEFQLVDEEEKDARSIHCPSRLPLTTLKDAGTWAKSFFQTVLDRSENTLTEIEIAGHYVQSGEVPLSLKSFPCLRKLSLVLYFYDDLYWEADEMSYNDFQGAVTLLSSKSSTTALNHLRFNCDSLLSPRNRKSLLFRRHSVVQELETILLAEPYTTGVTVTFEVSEPIKKNEAWHVEDAIKTAFPALQERGLLRVVFNRASGFGHNDKIRALVVSPRGDWIASVGSPVLNTGVLVWDPRTETILGELPCLEPHWRAEANIIIPLSEGPRLLIAGGGNVEIWDPTSQQHLTTLYTSEVTSAALITTREEILLATSDSEQHICIWDMKTHKPKKMTARGQLAPVWPSAISPDGRVLVFVPKDKYGTLALWDISADALLAQLVDDRGETDLRAYWHLPVFDEGGKILVSVSGCGVVLWWSTRTGELLRFTQLDTSGHISYRFRLSPHDKLACWISGRIYDNNLKLNLSETDKGRLLWSQPVRHRLNSRPSSIEDVSFSPTAEYIAVSTEDEPMQLLRVKDGKCVARNAHFNKAPAINVFSDDGAMLVTGAYDGTISVLRLCDISDSDEILESVVE